MLTHFHAEKTAPERVVVLGAGGFVGAATAARVVREGVPVLALTRREVDLLAPAASAVLADLLRPGDRLVFVSALAPVRTPAMLIDNLRMAEAVCAALQRAPVAHLVYISSDAVYRDRAEPLTESSCAEPASLHGAMHLAREVVLRNGADAPLALLRPSLLYGAADPHNGYGPNRFRRQAAAGGPILLFGAGEERRDHVLIDDVAELVWLTLAHRSTGILNIATGTVASFAGIADLVAGHFDPAPEIRTTPRQGPMPHDGYRPFDPAATHAAFPGFRYTPLDQGLARAHRESLREA